MIIIYKKENQEIFLSRWQEYLDSNLSSYKYLLSNIDYMLFYSTTLVEDLSFVVIQNNKCIGICFLPIEKNKNYLSISLADGYTISPIASNNKAEAFIFEEIDKIAQEQDVKIIKFFSDSLIQEYKNNSNALLKYNFIDSSSTTGIVDLKSDILWTNIRKHYKSMINKVLKDDTFEIFVMNNHNADYSIHEEYRLLHKKCAGVVTRAKETFDKQYEMLENGVATLIGLKYQDKFIGLQYFLHFQKTVVYASGADDPEYTQKGFNIYHPILWKAQEYFKSLSFEYLDYSQPFGYSKVQGFGDYLDDKQLNISYFKRGMGANAKTLYRAIKYYDKELFLNDLEIYKNNTLKN